MGNKICAELNSVTLRLLASLHPDNLRGDMEKDVHRQYGWLAETFGKRQLPLEICVSEAGFYLGTRDEHGEPFSRESDYWVTREEAERALLTGNWTQRPAP
jgi:hypothetical protein